MKTPHVVAEPSTMMPYVKVSFIYREQRAGPSITAVCVKEQYIFPQPL